MKGFVIGVFIFSLNGAAAAEAVSGPNGKLDFSAGNLDGWDGKTASGSAAGQLTNDIGWQGDALWSRIGGQDFYGLGGHVFWRDPERALVGITGSGIQRDGVDSYQLGLEGEYYFPRVTFLAGAGYANVKYDQPVPFIDSNAKGAYITAQVRYYLMDDLALSVGGLHALDNSLGMATVEYQTPVTGLSLFATAAKGDNDYDHAMLGIRYYIGKSKSLMARHRTDDPDNSATTNLWILGTYGAEYNKKMKTYIESMGSGSTGSSESFGSVDTILSVDYGVVNTAVFIEPLVDYGDTVTPISAPE